MVEIRGNAKVDMYDLPLSIYLFILSLSAMHPETTVTLDMAGTDSREPDPLQKVGSNKLNVLSSCSMP